MKKIQEGIYGNLILDSEAKEYPVENTSIPIYIEREFYNDRLITKGLSSVFDFRIGKRYYYDKEGNVEKVVDYDKGYNFTAADVIDYCIKNNILLVKKSGKYFGAKISKTADDEGNVFWRISYDRYGESTRIIMDGKTGEIIYTETKEIKMGDDLPRPPVN